MSLFYQPGIPDGNLALDADESRHAAKVLRLGKGDSISVTDGKGTHYKAVLTHTGKECKFEIVEKEFISKKPYHIQIAIAPTKNTDRIEWFAEKATEIGVDRISFMLCHHAERSIIKPERVEKKMIAAMKQSGQVWLPAVDDIQPFDKFMHLTADKFIAHVDSSNTDTLEKVARPNANYLILIGPEGDFSHKELAMANANGFHKVSLGPTRLRTETAGVVACHLLNLINTSRFPSHSK